LHFVFLTQFLGGQGLHLQGGQGFTLHASLMDFLHSGTQIGLGLHSTHFTQRGGGQGGCTGSQGFTVFFDATTTIFVPQD